MDSLSGLEYLTMSNSLVDSILFKKLANLRSLNLVASRADQNMNPFLLSNLTNLEQLRLENSIDLLPLNLEHLNKLTYIGLIWNNIGFIGPHLFRNLTCLRTLELSRNFIRSIEKNTFEELPALRSLDLSHNLLKCLDESWGLTSSLLELILADNLIETIEISSSSGFRGLDRLDLSFNKLEYLDRESFRGLHNLKYLNLSQNAATRFDNCFVGLSQLEILELKGMDACNYGLKYIRPESFVGLSSLKKLDLSKNELKEIERKCFEGLGSLEELILSWNNIELIELGVFKSLASLRILGLRGNKLEMIGMRLFEGLSDSLEELQLDSNRLRTINESVFNGFTRLKKIHLQNNKLRSFDLLGVVARSLRNLKIIDLRNNQIVAYECDVLEKLKNLNINVLIDLNKQ